MPLSQTLDSTTVRTRSQSVSDMQAISEKLDLLLADMGQIKSDGVLLKQDIEVIKNDNKTFKEDISKALDFYSEEIKEIRSDLENTTSKVNLQGVDIESIQSENICLKMEVSALKKKINAGAQYSRSNCLDIQGVPENKNESIIGIIKSVSNVLGFNFNPLMIDAAHRLAPNPSRPQEPRSIIVKFCRRIDMEEMRRLAIRKKGFSAADLGFSSDRRVFVNLSMTRETRVLWFETRKAKEDLQFKFAWITSSGKIFIRKSERTSAILIEDFSDIQKLRKSPGSQVRGSDTRSNTPSAAAAAAANSSPVHNTS